MTRVAPALRRRVALLAALPALLATGCTGASERPQLGVSFDRPGLSMRTLRDYSGFDYVLARDVAERLGHPGPKGADYLNVPERQAAPASGSLAYDVLVAAYPATDALRARTDLVGPYLRGEQQVAVRAGDPLPASASELSGQRVCLVAGTHMGRTAPSTFPGASITYRPTLSTCLTALRQRAVDAVSDEGLALRGYAAEAPFRGSITVGGVGLSPVDYYLAVDKDQPQLCREVRTALTQAVRDGSWTRMYAEQLVRTGVVTKAPAPPARITGCGA